MGDLPGAVLWDMDGTLVDTEPYWIASERALVSRFGGQWPDHHAHHLIGFDLLDAGAYIAEHGPVPMSPADIVDDLLDGVTARVRDDIPWRPGARELLAELVSLQVPCALVTMSWRRVASAVVEALPAGSFATVVCGDDVQQGKPHPEPYLVAAERLGVPPQRCVAIEDSPTGARSAVAAGCRTLGVPNVASIPVDVGAHLIESLDGVQAHELMELTN